MKEHRPILLVEDDVVDHMMVKRAFKELNVSNRLELVSDGEAALSYLRNSGNEKPSLIILDLNMPKLNGIEFLKIMKHDEELKMIPVVVLTTSREEQDMKESFMLGVAGYMVKPVEYEKFIDMVRTMTKYWTLSEVPA